MNVLFVASGNSKSFEVAPFVKIQAESLQRTGVNVRFFTINRKGIIGYIKESIRLRNYLKNHPIDIIHSHYTLSGWTTVLSFTRVPIVLSLMGDDTYGEYIGVNKISIKSRYLIILTYIIQPFVNYIICKSKHIAGFVYMKKKHVVIPNGVSINRDHPPMSKSKTDLGLDLKKQYLLFLGDKRIVRKNIKLVQDALKIIEDKNVELIAPYPLSHNDVFQYLSVVDALVLPSFMEGSPNVVKEAMACNCPVVATDVGDIRWLFADTPGYYLASFDPENFAEKIKLAIQFRKEHGHTRGRERLLKLGLDAETVSKQIIEIYKKVLS